MTKLLKERRDWTEPFDLTPVVEIVEPALMTELQNPWIAQCKKQFRHLLSRYAICTAAMARMFHCDALSEENEHAWKDKGELRCVLCHKKATVMFTVGAQYRADPNDERMDKGITNFSCNGHKEQLKFTHAIFMGLEHLEMALNHYLVSCEKNGIKPTEEHGLGSRYAGWKKPMSKWLDVDSDVGVVAQLCARFIQQLKNGKKLITDATTAEPTQKKRKTATNDE